MNTTRTTDAQCSCSITSCVRSSILKNVIQDASISCYYSPRQTPRRQCTAFECVYCLVWNTVPCMCARRTARGNHGFETALGLNAHITQLIKGVSRTKRDDKTVHGLHSYHRALTHARFVSVRYSCPLRLWKLGCHEMLHAPTLCCWWFASNVL